MGKVERHKIDYQIRQIMSRNRDGSPDRQAARHRNLMRFIGQLQDRGYSKRWDVHRLGKKEVSRLVDDWRRQGLAHRTIANYMVDIRWLASKIGREHLIPSNKDIGVGLRKNAPSYGINKAMELDRGKLEQLPERERLITELRREFGLRTEEAIKFSHRYATAKGDDEIQLKASWTKGGRPREIAITRDAQRDLLDRIARFQKAHRDYSMIPRKQSFRSYYRDYNEARAAVDIPGHPLRHQWAQQRFEEVSQGIKSPHAGGPRYSTLSDEEKLRWDQAASVVNRELGHGEGRQDITATYIGARD